MARGKPPRLDLTGQRFGRLVVVERAADVDGKWRSLSAWVCRCDCGKSHVVQTSHLRAGRVRSCGCIYREVSREKLKVIRPLATSKVVAKRRCRVCGSVFSAKRAQWYCSEECWSQGRTEHKRKEAMRRAIGSLAKFKGAVE